ncbi:MAG TPA: aminoacyl-tRNA hydrolase [Candidatus Magasanikbacteria bacterium]|jgi:PTH1 family peptidyl-tRNA hydrolase|nr:aminoacyl-tRNA hydrolase [Candidatus Magasanikbacteria bacterium]HQF57123.1 aminoacyl-tRNA hydrolase [Candidatus Magasanikbacteria bacterium]HQL52900.1 aminoacyl-tRNA hydrolase [Candidatus Magasanikbacteria bacterium]
MYLIVGLGNPGKQYEKTRHNVGFMVLENLQEKLLEYGISKWELSKKFNAEICGTSINNQKIILVKPMTFMNDSGIAVQIISHFYKIKIQELIVIHDDKDLPLGEIKIQTGCGDAGHNGIKSIIKHLGTKNFHRIRIGIASENPKKMADTAKFVLNKFAFSEKKKINEIIEQTTEKIIILIQTTKK